PKLLRTKYEISGDEATHARQLVVRALGVGLRLLARGVGDLEVEEQRSVDVRREALLALGELVEELVERLERQAEIVMLALQALLEVQGMAHPARVAVRSARHVAGER